MPPWPPQRWPFKTVNTVLSCLASVRPQQLEQDTGSDLPALLGASPSGPSLHLPPPLPASSWSFLIGVFPRQPALPMDTTICVKRDRLHALWAMVPCCIGGCKKMAWGWGWSASRLTPVGRAGQHGHWLRWFFFSEKAKCSLQLVAPLGRGRLVFDSGSLCRCPPQSLWHTRCQRSARRRLRPLTLGASGWDASRL